MEYSVLNLIHRYTTSIHERLGDHDGRGERKVRARGAEWLQRDFLTKQGSLYLRVYSNLRYFAQGKCRFMADRIPEWRWKVGAKSDS